MIENNDPRNSQNRNINFIVTNDTSLQRKYFSNLKTKQIAQ